MKQMTLRRENGDVVVDQSGGGFEVEGLRPADGSVGVEDRDGHRGAGRDVA